MTSEPAVEIDDPAVVMHDPGLVKGVPRVMMLEPGATMGNPGATTGKGEAAGGACIFIVPACIASSHCIRSGIRWSRPVVPGEPPGERYSTLSTRMGSTRVAR